MNIDFTRILSRAEIATVVAELRRKRRSPNTRQNHVIFRLACFCGLRVGEITKLRLSDVRIAGDRPHIRIPASISKSRRGKDRRRVGRKVPLWWDAVTMGELAEWKMERQRHGAGDEDPFVCSQAQGTFGKPLSVRNAQHRFKTALRILGAERQSELSIHCGRHSFCSHALAGGRNLVEVRDAAGHANVSTTSLYLHATDDSAEKGDLFSWAA